MKIMPNLSPALGAAALFFGSQAAFAGCGDVSRQELIDAVQHVKTNPDEQAITNGLKNNSWVTMVDNTGMVCHIVNSAGDGQLSSKTWGVSRVISVQKADTSALLSLNAVGENAIQPWSSGNVYLAAQPGGFLYGVQHSNPVRADQAYLGVPSTYGTDQDPLKGKRIGGINVFGGGIPLYKGGKKVGAIGASGDTSCTDHAFAWRVRIQLQSTAGIDASTGSDFEVVTLDNTATPKLDGHPQCPNMPLIDPTSTGLKVAP